MSTLTTREQTALEQQLLHLKQQLQEQLELGQTATETVVLDQSKVGRLSRMDAIQQQHMARSSRQNTLRQLNFTLAALRKIADREYGYCEDCGEDIPFARLKVRPEAPLCLDCQTRQE